MSRVNRTEYKDWKGLGARTRKTRENMGLTREKFSEMTNRTENYIISLEKGDKGCSLHTLHQICSTLRISPNYILYGKDGEDEDMNKEYTDKETIMAIIEKCNDKELKVLKEVIIAIYPNFQEIMKDKDTN